MIPLFLNKDYASFDTEVFIVYERQNCPTYSGKQKTEVIDAHDAYDKIQMMQIT